MDIIPQPETDATSSASYWGVIPGPVRYCKALQPAAKLLFTEITALVKREGYCWASNAHFQALYGVDRSTVKRWLAALQREGFIRIELVPGTGVRRIYDLTTTPEQFRAGAVSKVRQARRVSAPSPAQNVPPHKYNELEKKKEIESDAGARGKFVGPGPVPARELQAGVKQETASPSTVKSKSGSEGPSASKIRNVQRVIALTKDTDSRENLGRLWDRLHASGNSSAWSEAVDRVKTLPNRSSLPPERLTQNFVNIVALLADMS